MSNIKHRCHDVLFSVLSYDDALCHQAPHLNHSVTDYPHLILPYVTALCVMAGLLKLCLAE